MNIPDWMTTEEIGVATLDNEHLGILSEHVLCCWPSTKAEVQKDLQLYWSFRHDIAIITQVELP